MNDEQEKNHMDEDLFHELQEPRVCGTKELILRANSLQDRLMDKTISPQEI